MVIAAAATVKITYANFFPRDPTCEKDESVHVGFVLGIKINTDGAQTTFKYINTSNVKPTGQTDNRVARFVAAWTFGLHVREF